jgi:hypothetical protein
MKCDVGGHGERGGESVRTVMAAPCQLRIPCELEHGPSHQPHMPVPPSLALSDESQPTDCSDLRES